jgi:hypothetical protein
MNIPVDIRAALKWWDTSPTTGSRAHVHGVSLNEWRWNRGRLRRLRSRRRETMRLGPWPVVEAICGRRVREVSATTFRPEFEDNPCPECTQLMQFLPWDPEQLPEQAQRIRQRVQEDERRKQQEWRRRQEQQDAYWEAEHILNGADDLFEDEPSPRLMELLRRDQDRPDATSHTA